MQREVNQYTPSAVDGTRTIGSLAHMGGGIGHRRSCQYFRAWWRIQRSLRAETCATAARATPMGQAFDGTWCYLSGRRGHVSEKQSVLERTRRHFGSSVSIQKCPTVKLAAPPVCSFRRPRWRWCGRGAGRAAARAPALWARRSLACTVMMGAYSCLGRNSFWLAFLQIECCQEEFFRHPRHEARTCGTWPRIPLAITQHLALFCHADKGDGHNVGDDYIPSLDMAVGHPV